MSTIDTMLKLAGADNIEQFYSMFPTEEAFMKKHGKAFKKAQTGDVFKNLNISKPGFPTPPPTAPVQLGTEDFVGSYMKQQRSPELRNSQLLSSKSQGTGSNIDFAKAIPIAGDIIGGIDALNQEFKKVKSTKQDVALTNVLSKASKLKPEPINRKYLRPEYNITSGNELYPMQGIGQATPLARNGGEIQNTYAPNTLYTDLEKAQTGAAFTTMMNAGGAGALNKISSSVFNDNAGSQIGRGVGSALAMVPGIGPIASAVASPVLSLIGGGIDKLFGPAGDIRQNTKAAERNMLGIIAQQGMSGIHNSFGESMEEGGYISNNWQPQVITQFGGHKLSDLLRKDPIMDTLRTGGNLRSNMQQSGELNIGRGKATPISYNPFLPNNGETVMFEGPSHDDGGMPINYAGNNVEVEGGEPMVQLRDGGNPMMDDSNLSAVVYGNLKHPGTGKKFKKEAEEISKKENKANKIVERSTEKLNQLKPISAYDKLLENSYTANILGSNMKLKKFAEDKQDLAALQQSINDTADELGIDADALSKNNIKMAKNGAKLTTAQNGNTMYKYMDYIKKYFPPSEWNNAYKIMMAESTGRPSEVHVNNDQKITNPKGKYWQSVDTGLFQINNVAHPELYAQGDLTDPETNVKAAAEIWKKNGWDAWTTSHVLSNQKSPLNTYPVVPVGSSYNDELGEQPRTTLGQYPIQGASVADKILNDYYISKIDDVPDGKKDIIKPISAQVTSKLTKPVSKERLKPMKSYTVKEKNYDWMDKVIEGANTLLPYLRPSDVEGLNPMQMMGELYAMTNNQEEPVQAQLYQPQLGTPYEVSLQDQLNEITSQTRAAQRMAGYNPAAQAMIAAQAYEPKSKVLGEQFRLNQAMRNQVISENRNLLNQSQLQNLQILDQQYARQAEAKAKTKATMQAALNSISDKYLKNSLENRTLATYENLYNYRFDPDYKARNFNPLQTFETDIQGTQVASTEKPTDKKTKKTETTTARNGAIVKAMHSL